MPDGLRVRIVRGAEMRTATDGNDSLMERSLDDGEMMMDVSISR
jgi:hypothetical protein